MAAVEKEILIDAPRARVWTYFEDPDLLAAWLMRNNFTGRVGEKFQFFARPSATWDGVLQCKLVEFEPPERIAYTWNANDIGGETLVTIELEEEGKGTRVRLTHSRFERASLDVAPIVKRHDEGWADHLGILAVQVSESLRGGQTPKPYDWTRFDLHVAVGARPDRVLDMWATVDGMESFFVEMMRITGPDGRERPPGQRAKPEDKYMWRWHNGRALAGRYLAAESPNEVGLTFGESKVRVRAFPYREGTLLQLTQYGIPDDDAERMHTHTNCRAAWVYFLTCLKAHFEHGVDVRDRTRETGSSFSTYFDPAALGIAGLG